MTIEDAVAELIISLVSDATVAFIIFGLSKDYMKNKVNEIVDICIQDARERNKERIKLKKDKKNEQNTNGSTLPEMPEI